MSISGGDLSTNRSEPDVQDISTAWGRSDAIIRSTRTASTVVPASLHALNDAMAYKGATRAGSSGTVLHDTCSVIDANAL